MTAVSSVRIVTKASHKGTAAPVETITCGVRDIILRTVCNKRLKVCKVLGREYKDSGE